MSDSETDHGTVIFGDEGPFAAGLVGNQHVENLGGKDLMAERYEDSDYAEAKFPENDAPAFVEEENRRIAAISVAQSLNPGNVDTLLDAARRIEAYLSGAPDTVPDGASDATDGGPGVTGAGQG